MPDDSRAIAPFIDPRDAAVLVIDMQNGFCHPESAMGQALGWDPSCVDPEAASARVHAQMAIVPHIGTLVAWARDRNIPVLWSRQVHLPDDVTRTRRRIASHAQRQGFLPCLRNTWETEFAPGIATLIDPAADAIIEKHRASVFHDTTLATRLRMLGTHTLVIAGCNTEFCVESTVREAYARDYDIVVVEDCVAGIRDDFHREALTRFRAYFGEVLPVAALDAMVMTP